MNFRGMSIVVIPPSLIWMANMKNITIDRNAHTPHLPYRQTEKIFRTRLRTLVRFCGEQKSRRTRKIFGLKPQLSAGNPSTGLGPAIDTRKHTKHTRKSPNTHEATHEKSRKTAHCHETHEIFFTPPRTSHRPVPQLSTRHPELPFPNTVEHVFRIAKTHLWT